MSRYMKKRYQGFASYTPGEQRNDGTYVKLNTNESPFPPAPKVLAALEGMLPGSSPDGSLSGFEALSLYPDPTGRTLKEKLAALHGVAPENIFLSNGSDDILNFAMMAFVDDDEAVAFPEITYSFNDVIADLHGVKVNLIPMRPDPHAGSSDKTGDELFIDPADYCGLNQNIIIPNPNAPTGTVLTPGEIEEIIRTNPDHVVLIDEAYADFGAESVIPLTKKYDNLLVSHTFSKYASFAGGRLGYAVGSPGLIRDLMTIQYSTNPYNINRLTMTLAEATVDADAYYRANAEKIRATRARVTGELERMGFEVIPSLANFVFAKHQSIPGRTIYEEMLRRFVLIRHFDNPKITDYNRISIGSDEQMDIFLERLRDVLRESDSK